MPDETLPADSSTVEVEAPVELADRFYSKPDAKADPSPATSSATPAKPGAVQTEAATEPADQDTEPETDAKPAKSAKNNWADMRSARYRAEAERDHLRQQLEEHQRKAASLPAKAVEEKKPATGLKAEDFDDYADFVRAAIAEGVQGELSKREAAQAEARRQADEASAQQKQQAEAKTIADAWTERVNTTRAEIADFEQVAFSPKLPLNHATVRFVTKSPQGPAVMYQLGSDLKEAQRIAQLDDIDTMRELVLIEKRLVAKETAKGSTQTITRAPRPSGAVTGSPGVPAEVPLWDRLYKTPATT